MVGDSFVIGGCIVEKSYENHFLNLRTNDDSNFDKYLHGRHMVRGR